MKNRKNHLLKLPEFLYHEKWWWMRLLITIFLFWLVISTQTHNSITTICTSFLNDNLHQSEEDGTPSMEGLILTHPDLSLSINHEKATCGLHGILTYTITLANIGSTEINTIVTYNFPAEFISHSWSCKGSSPSSICNTSTLPTDINDTVTVPIGESITYTINVFTISMMGIIKEVFRYSLAPFTALVGAFMLGAHYIDDIYNLQNYRSALFYLWASIFNGKSTRLLTGLLAIAPFMLIIMLGLLYLGFPFEDSPENLLLILLFSLAGGIGFGFLFGKSFLPEMTISEGKKDFDATSKTIDVIGGPGWVYVEPSNVILLERLDSPSDVFGAGQYFIPRSHRVKDIFSLKDQHAPPRDLVAHTLDGIKVTVKDFQYRYRLHTGKNKIRKRTQASPYPFSVEAVRKIAYERNVTASGGLADWENVIQFGFDGTVLSYIRENELGSILDPDSDQEPREKFDKEINSARTRDTIKGKGAELLWHDTGYFEIGDDIDKEKIKTWLAKLKGKISIIRAQGKAELVAHKERAHAEGQVAVLQGIIQALETTGLPDNVDENLWNIVLAQSSQILEIMNNAHQNKSTDTPENKNEQAG